jgi:RNA recognition motif-containing protein
VIVLNNSVVFLLLIDRAFSRGYGTVTFETSEQAQIAIENLHDSELDGRSIIVRFDRPASSRPIRRGRRGRGARGVSQEVE